MVLNPIMDAEPVKAILVETSESIFVSLYDRCIRRVLEYMYPSKWCL